MYQLSAVHTALGTVYTVLPGLQCSQAVWVFFSRIYKKTACFCAGLRSARLPWHKLDGKTWFWIFFICYFASFAGLHYSLSHFKRDKRSFKKSLVKSSNNNFIFLPVFYLIIWFMTSLKDFLKNNHFENMTAGFVWRCQNSLRWEISLICHWSKSCLLDKLWYPKWSKISCTIFTIQGVKE